MPTLRAAVYGYLGAEKTAAQTRGLANAIGESLPRLHDRLSQVNRSRQRLEQAMAGPEKALEAVVREIGTEGTRLASSRRCRAHFTSLSSSPSGRLRGSST